MGRTLLSSKYTVIAKFVQPPIFMIILYFSFSKELQESLQKALGNSYWIVLGVVGGFILHNLKQSVILKKVELEGDHLIVSNFLKEWIVPLREIEGLRENTWSRNRLIRIYYRNQKSTGNSIVFRPAGSWKRGLDVHPVTAQLEALLKPYLPTPEPKL
jgi:hypothetical protein